MKCPSHLAVLALFLRTASPQCESFVGDVAPLQAVGGVCSSAEALGDPSVPSRTATVHRAGRVTRGGRLLDKAFAAAMILTVLMLCNSTASTVLDSYRLQDMQSGSRLPIWPEDYARLQKASCSDPTVRPSQVDAVLSTITGTDQGWVAQSAKKLAEKRFEESGIEGFEPISAREPCAVRLRRSIPRLASPRSRLWGYSSCSSICPQRAWLWA